MQAGVSASRRAAWIAWVAGAVPVVVAALFIGYTSIFSHYLWYDDEGYVMISVHGYLRGHPLFREVYTQYGPFFFFTRRAIYALLGVPVSHDANRLIALGEWLAAAGLCGVVAGRLTRSAWMGLLAGSLAFVHLEVFVKEPGHPEQLCMLLVATALVLGTLGRRSVGLVGMGVVCAALATTKVNIGAYLTAAILLALLLAGARQRLGREALGLVAALVVGLPIVVMYAGLELPSSRAYAAIVTAAVAAALVAGHDPARPRVLSWADLLRFAVPVPLVVLAVLGATRLQGTTWWDLAEGLVLEPLRFAVVFKAAPMPLGQEGLLAGAAGLATSLVTLGPPRWRASLGWLKLVFGVGVQAVALAEFIVGADRSFTIGNATRGHAEVLLAWGTPFLWLLVVPDRERPWSFDAYFGRVLLCFAAVLLALVAYPVFGTQGNCATVLTLVAAVVATSDAVASRGGRWRVVPFVAFAPLALALGLHADFFGRLYRTNPPLGLWGASRVHLAPAQVETFTALTRELTAHADTFITIMGVNSLYFWTRLDPPTYFNGNLWPWMLSHAEQRRVVEALAAHRRAMVVEDASRGYLQHRLAVDPDGPLGAYIAADFVSVAGIGQYRILVHRGRPWPPLGGSS
jgi:hypothetical protein